jgi:hypothetical protein
MLDVLTTATVKTEGVQRRGVGGNVSTYVGGSNGKFEKIML